MSIQNQQAVTRSFDLSAAAFTLAHRSALAPNVARARVRSACRRHAGWRPPCVRWRSARPTGTIDYPKLALHLAPRHGLGHRVCRSVQGGRVVLAQSCQPAEIASDNKPAKEPRPLRLPRFWLKLRHALNRNSRRGSRRNIAAHYDLGNDFYEQWLDAGMTYSSGLFSSAGQTLEEAQDAKLDRVIDMLDLSGGEMVLEIGCGWGSLAERLMDRRDCVVTGVTLSSEQLAFARRRLRNRAQSGRCDLCLQDYRDIRGEFDRIVSIEMLEAVGESILADILQETAK